MLHHDKKTEENAPSHDPSHLGIVKAIHPQSCERLGEQEVEHRLQARYRHPGQLLRLDDIEQLVPGFEPRGAYA